MLQVERTERVDGGRSVRLLEAVHSGQNIAPLGHEVKLGETVLESGRWIGPAEIGVLATFGCHQVPVFRKPTAAWPPATNWSK